MKTAFVVLHYNQIEVTIDCIDSLLNLNGEKQVVVVDNASPDGSGKLLVERYKSNSLVHVILNESNFGFASANNIGYAYAKKQLDAKIIVVMNNDTLINDSNFLIKLTSSNLLSEFHIVAPDITNKQGIHQNPFSLKPMSYQTIVRNYKRLAFICFVYSIPVLGDIKAYLSKRKKSYNKESYQTIREMVVPHGAAVIYTPLWVEKEDFAFYPGTFMYLEEDILFYYVQTHSYKTIYWPELKIYHIDDVSTNGRFRNIRKKSVFQCKQMRKSYRVLIRYINSQKECLDKRYFAKIQ